MTPTFEKIVSREGIPKHYLSARAPRYNRVVLDIWLSGCRCNVARPQLWTYVISSITST
jgi:hypothetical protein